MNRVAVFNRWSGTTEWTVTGGAEQRLLPSDCYRLSAYQKRRLIPRRNFGPPFEAVPLQHYRYLQGH